MTQEQAVQKARELIASGKSYVMATVDAKGAPQMRWMGALAQDPSDENVCYILSGAQARKVDQLLANPAVQLLFSTPDWNCVVTADGVADMVDDRDIKHMVWDAVPAAKEYFSGPDGEDFGVIRFRLQCLEILCMGEAHEPVRVEVCS